MGTALCRSPTVDNRWRNFLDNPGRGVRFLFRLFGGQTSRDVLRLSKKAFEKGSAVCRKVSLGWCSGELLSFFLR